MGIASLVLGVLSLIFAIGGFVATVVPGLGAVLSFSSPILALVGIVLGGVALSRARQEGGETGMAITGLVVSIVMLFPALFVAFFCGLCNTCVTAGALSPNRTQPWIVDAGPSTWPAMPIDPNAPVDPSAVDPNAPVDPSAVDPNAPVDPSAVDPSDPGAPVDPDVPPPAFPPPPAPP
ncbi:MAG: hypothetical protein K8H88_03565 [Sandaracinaceae bacterium]|nr:hypothetical protein [Sandaracinaceae bacterium]